MSQFNFLQGGDAVAAAFDQQAKAQNQEYIPRFWIKKGEQKTITFVDGGLNANGLLDIPFARREHNIQLNGRWGNHYACTKQDVTKDTPCPLCAADNKAALVAYLTIIDHTAFQTKDNQTRQNERKLFAFKRMTLEKLQYKAANAGGLAGKTFSVMRLNVDKSCGVGDEFDFKGDYGRDTIIQRCGLKPQGDNSDNKVYAPYNYAEMLKYHTAEELLAMGLGVPPTGYQPPSGVGIQQVPAQTDPFAGAQQQPAQVHETLASFDGNSPQVAGVPDFGNLL